MNVRQFYLDERRQTSDEATFGLDRTMDTDPKVRYGLHWIEKTKEIYILRGPTPPIFLRDGPRGFGATPPTFADDEFEVIVLGTAETREVLQQALVGWEARMDEPNSLQWGA